MKVKETVLDNSADKFTLVLNDQNLETSNKWNDIVRVIDTRGTDREVILTKKDLQNMVKNFDNNVLNRADGEIQFNYSHNSYDIAAGWITDVRVKGDILQAKVRWTPKGKQTIIDEEFKYISAEISYNYADRETKKAYGLTLTGAGLTNIPFVPGMNAVALSNTENSKFFNNNPLKMNKFKNLLSSLNKSDVTLSEFAGLQCAMAMLDDAEQESVKEEVAKVEETAQANAKVSKEAEEKAAKELSDLKEKVELSTKDEASKITALTSKVDAQAAQLAEQKESLDAAKLETRKANLSVKLEDLSAEGKLTPAEVQSWSKIILDSSEAQEEAMLKTLSDSPVKVKLNNERGNGGGQGEDEEAKAYAELEERKKAGDTRSDDAILSDIYAEMPIK